MGSGRCESFDDLFDSDSEVSDSFDMHSSDEVISTVDEAENELVQLSTHLNIDLEHDRDRKSVV